jgi:uncharacterized protein YdeI (YjbR/CyaY-like superfamily)
MRDAETLYLANRDDWREWLEKNHDTEKEVWLIFYKTHTSKPTIPYEDAVEEALCFGWIDSIIKKIDDEKFARKFTPRKTKSKWSKLNKKRVEKMITEGKMSEAGLTQIEEAKKSGEWFKTVTRQQTLVIPPFIKEALAANKKALDNFNNLAISYKRQYIGWITNAKRKEALKRRLEEVIKVLEKNEKLGMK